MNFSKKILDNYTLSSKKALNFKVNNQWDFYTWEQFHNLTKQTANALLKKGVKPNDTIGIYSENIPEWIIFHFAILNIGAISVPIYASMTAQQAKYILDESEINTILVGDKKQYDNILDIQNECGYLKNIIIAKNNIDLKNENSYHFYELIKNESLICNICNKSKEDIASIIYTSGTTGEPKGVMLSHGNYLDACEAHIKFFNIYPKNENSLVFLPLSHIFEKAWSSFVLYCGGELSFCENPREIATYLLEVQPTTMCAVPRLFQKIYSSINDKINNSSPITQKIFNWATKVGEKVSELKRKEKNIPIFLGIKYQLANKLVFEKIKKQLGGKLWFIPVGGASITPNITKFFDSIGIHLTIGYGMTETTATVTALPFTKYEHGTAGIPVNGTQIKLSPENEILIKGYGIFKGYYKKEEETKNTFTEDGWLKTGDVGKIDEYGNLTITDRIKDLMKTSNGKYICPQPIENILTNDNYIQQAIIIGDNRQYVTALIVPNFDALIKHAKSINITFNSLEELINNSIILNFYTEKINLIQKNLAEFEKIKKFKLLSSEFDIDSGEITPTLKIKRKVVIEKYKNIIDKLY